MAKWTITYTPSGGGSAVTLAGAASDHFDQPEGETGITFANLDQVQTAPVLRATRPKRWMRKNRLVTAEFTVNRAHADLPAAIVHAAAEIARYTVLGTVTFSDGTTTITLYNADVAVKGGAQGATSRWSYTITGTLSS